MNLLSEKEFYKIIRTTRFRLFRAPNSKTAAYEEVINLVTKDVNDSVSDLSFDLERAALSRRYLIEQRAKRLETLTTLLDEHLNEDYPDDSIFITNLEILLRDMKKGDVQ